MILLPPLLSPGDRVHVVAPSSPVPRAFLFPGLAWLQQRYRLSMSACALSRKGYLAGDDDARAADLARAMVDPDVRAILVARGGYGLTRIVDRLPWDRFTPKWIAGFSDVTALHVRLGQLGVPSVHAPNVTGLGIASPKERLAYMHALEHGRTKLEWKLSPIRDANVEGITCGGNLALLCAMATTMEVIPPKSIVVIEDVTERPYRIDRMLTSLLAQLARASALVFGDFTECDPGPDGVTASEVIDDLATRISVPIFKGAPVGHGSPNEPFVLGACVAIEKGVLYPRG